MKNTLYNKVTSGQSRLLPLSYKLKFLKLKKSSSVWVIKQTYVWVSWKWPLFSKRVITSDQIIWNISCIGGSELSPIKSSPSSGNNCVRFKFWELIFKFQNWNFTKGLKRTWTSKALETSVRIRCTVSKTCECFRAFKSDDLS